MKLKFTLLTLFMFYFSFITFSQTILHSADIGASDHFGRAVEISGDYLFVADNNFSELNKIIVFKRENGDWVEKTSLSPSEMTSLHGYGQALDADGNYLVVGAPNEHDEGRAYVFKRTGEDWALDATLVSSDIASDDEFGDAVAISGTTIIVGASQKNAGNGAAYVFSLEGGTWVEKEKLDPGAGSWSLFGTFMAMQGDYAVISAHQRERVFIYHWDGNNWTEQAELLSPDNNNNSFGLFPTISGDRILVGSLRDDEVAENAGAAYIYKRTSTTWTLEQKLLASDGMEDVLFGGRSALSENYAVVCALYDNNSFTSGSAYIFKREGNSWVEMEKHTTGGSDYFGWYAAIHDNVAVVGAYASSLAAASGGAVYLFDLPMITSSTASLELQAVNMDLFPNPANHYLNIQSEIAFENYSIIDTKGALVQVGTLSSNQVFIGNLSPGLYYFKAVSSENIAVSQFVKE